MKYIRHKKFGMEWTAFKYFKYVFIKKSKWALFQWLSHIFQSSTKAFILYSATKTGYKKRNTEVIKTLSHAWINVRIKSYSWKPLLLHIFMPQRNLSNTLSLPVIFDNNSKGGIIERFKFTISSEILKIMLRTSKNTKYPSWVHSVYFQKLLYMKFPFFYYTW